MKLLLLIPLLFSAWSVNAQSDGAATLKQINQHFNESFNAKDYATAEKLAEQAVELSIKIYGPSHWKTGIALSNLGVVKIVQRKYKEAVENLKKAAVIFEAVPNLKTYDLIGAYESLALSYYLDGKKAQAEANYLKAVGAVEKTFGPESKESFSPMLNTANYYAMSGKYEKANEYYVKSYVVAFEHFGLNAKEVEQVEDSRMCSFGISRLARDQSDGFHDVRKKYVASLDPPSRILNGKALSFPKPEYPSEAKAQRIGGSVIMRVKIDEQGNVAEIRAICGPSILAKASVAAAKGAKFSPTLIDGKPVKVSGVITYNFVP